MSGSPGAQIAEMHPGNWTSGREFRTYGAWRKQLPVREAEITQLGRGARNWKVQQANGRESMLARVQFGPRSSGYIVPSPSMTGIIIPIAWHCDYLLNGRISGVGDAFVVSASKGYAYVGENRDQFSVGLNTSGLSRSIAALNGVPDDEIEVSDCVVELGEIRGRELQRQIFLILQSSGPVHGTGDDAVLSEYAESQLLDTMAMAIVSDKPESAGSFCDMGRSALTIIRSALHAVAHAHRVPTISELCAASRVGKTRLHESFISMFGISPMQYLRYTRLTRAREWLSNRESPPRSVKDVAFYFGFSNGGRFAAEYRQLFDEDPSTTFKKTIRESSSAERHLECPHLREAP
jgi:AraC-like DNA-binding protein